MKFNYFLLFAFICLSTTFQCALISKKNTSKDRIVPPKGMVYVEGGVFKMGNNEGKKNEKPLHSVEVSSFYMDQYEITFEEYDAFCVATNKPKSKDDNWGRGQRPAIYVSWYDAIEYCNWRSEEEGLNPCYTINKKDKDDNNKDKYDDVKWTITCDWSAKGYRLPTEAEWEYAAGGGAKNRTKWAGTNDINDLNRYMNGRDSTDNYKYTAPVGSFLPNALMLYDMSGNVWEWCWDWYDEKYYNQYSNKIAQNPHGFPSGKYRVLRCGSWFADFFLPVTKRNCLTPYLNYNDIGFRCVRGY